MGMYEKGAVRIHFEEAGSGFPLLVIAGGGLNSTIAGLSGPSSPFNPMVKFWLATKIQMHPDTSLGTTPRLIPTADFFPCPRWGHSSSKAPTC